MANYIQDNRAALKSRHYLLLANQVTRWFNASPSVLAKFQQRYSDSFCLVLWRNGSEDDAYVIPFERIVSLLTRQNIVRGSGDHLRWHGGIKSGRLALRGTSHSVPVTDCHNACHLLRE